MKKSLFYLLTALLILLMNGCGGGGVDDPGGGGGGGGDILIDDQLVGLWYVVDVSENDIIQPISSTLGWQQGWTHQTLDLYNNGEAIRRSYSGTTLSLTENGTWTSQNQAGNYKFGNVTTNFNYMVYWDAGTPWNTEITYSDNGHNYKANYVKAVDLVAHREDMTRTWVVRTSQSPSPVMVENTETPIGTYFDMPAECDTITVQLLEDGTFIAREMNGYEVVTSETRQWASGGSTFQIVVEDLTIRGYSKNGGFEWIFLDPELGQSVDIFWQTWASFDNHPTEFTGKWQAISVTEDSALIDMATFFGWDAQVTNMINEFWSDGTLESRRYAGQYLNDSELGVWSVNGNTLRIQSVEYQMFDYTVNGNSIVLTASMDGHTYVITFNKVD